MTAVCYEAAPSDAIHIGQLLIKSSGMLWNSALQRRKGVVMSNNRGQLEIVRLAGFIGAEIRGIKVSEPLSDEIFAEVRRVLLDHQVIFLRDQSLTYTTQLAFARRLGEPMAHPIFGGPEEQPFVRAMDSLSGALANHWHTDYTFVQQPAAFSLLHAIVIPQVGGDTMWANTVAAYRSLSPELRGLAKALRIVHSTDSDYTDATGGPGRENLHEAEHPLVRVHPETGEHAILLGGFARRVVGYGPQSSRDLIRLLQDHVTRPEHTIRWKWLPGDFAIWDNQATQHYAIRDYGDDHRRLERITVAGPVPVGIDGRPSVTLSSN